MRCNSTTAIEGGSSCWLVPYRRAHVQRYHQWFLDYPALLEATGSEPMTLEEEYAMQRSWREDEDKCTFIVLSQEEVKSVLPEDCKDGMVLPAGFVASSVGCMAGDVNLFLSDYEPDDEDDDSNDETESSLKSIPSTSSPIKGKTVFRQAEIDIMIAAPHHQRAGMGRESVRLMLQYATTHLSIDRFFCRINASNTASLRLFRSESFTDCGYAACFDQFTLERWVTADELVAESPLRLYECPAAAGYDDESVIDPTDDDFIECKQSNAKEVSMKT